VEKVCIWTPDKDLAQCVVEDRVVQVDRRGKTVRDADGVRAKFGVAPTLIPDWLALVGDVADGYPGISGIGAVGAARLLNRHGPIESFPPEVLGARIEQALVRGSRRCAPTRSSSAARRRCAGAARRPRSRHGPSVPARRACSSAASLQASIRRDPEISDGASGASRRRRA
jgi:5'-3' exonuclease